MNELLKAASDLVEAMDTCHICKASLDLSDLTPIHCEDCPSGCEHHEPPDCISVRELVSRLRILLEQAQYEAER